MGGAELVVGCLSSSFSLTGSVAIGKERVAMAVGKERENLKVDREKKNKLLIYIATITMQICTVTIASVYIYTFLHPLIWVVLEKNCVNFAQF